MTHLVNLFSLSNSKIVVGSTPCQTPTQACPGGSWRYMAQTAVIVYVWQHNSSEVMNLQNAQLGNRVPVNISKVQHAIRTRHFFTCRSWHFTWSNTIGFATRASVTANRRGFPECVSLVYRRDLSPRLHVLLASSIDHSAPAMTHPCQVTFVSRLQLLQACVTHGLCSGMHIMST